MSGGVLYDMKTSDWQKGLVPKKAAYRSGASIDRGCSSSRVVMVPNGTDIMA
jgi:hypothetical protein